MLRLQRLLIIICVCAIFCHHYFTILVLQALNVGHHTSLFSLLRCAKIVPLVCCWHATLTLELLTLHLLMRSLKVLILLERSGRFFGTTQRWSVLVQLRIDGLLSEVLLRIIIIYVGPTPQRDLLLLTILLHFVFVNLFLFELCFLLKLCLEFFV